MSRLQSGKVALPLNMAAHGQVKDIGATVKDRQTLLTCHALYHDIVGNLCIRYWIGVIIIVRLAPFQRIACGACCQ